MVFNILLVCTANVCRSPVATILLDDVLDSEVGDKIVTSSAGLDATDGAGICAKAQRWLRRQNAPFPANLDAHRARALRPEEMETADLVLTMEWPAVGRIRRRAFDGSGADPRARTFTLAEAAALGSYVTSARRSLFSGDTHPLCLLVQEMDACRGLPGTAPRQRGRASSDWRTIPDAHMGRGRATHRSVLGDVAAATQQLGRVVECAARLAGDKS